MDFGVTDSLGGAFPNNVYATLQIGASIHNHQCTPAGKIIYSNSRVHGNRTLYADARSYHYKLYIYLLVPSFASSRGCRGRELGGMVNYIQLTIIQCCSNFYCIVTLLLYIELLVDS